MRVTSPPLSRIWKHQLDLDFFQAWAKNSWLWSNWQFLLAIHSIMYKNNRQSAKCEAPEFPATFSFWNSFPPDIGLSALYEWEQYIRHLKYMQYMQHVQYMWHLLSSDAKRQRNSYFYPLLKASKVANVQNTINRAELRCGTKTGDMKQNVAAFCFKIVCFFCKILCIYWCS